MSLKIVKTRVSYESRAGKPLTIRYQLRAPLRVALAPSGDARASPRRADCHYVGEQALLGTPLAAHSGSVPPALELLHACAFAPTPISLIGRLGFSILLIAPRVLVSIPFCPRHCSSSCGHVCFARPDIVGTGVSHTRGGAIQTCRFQTL